MEEKQEVVGRHENERDADVAKGHVQASGISASITKDDGDGGIGFHSERCDC